jgi:tripartite-type tricarboxylate transporter receptor subunit TctC
MRKLAAAIAASLALSTLGLLSLPAGAQTWPNQPLKIVSPFPPGGTNDTVARIIAFKLGENLGQPVVVDNRAGAGGMIGSEYVAKSPPDGYTLLMSTPGPITINRFLFAKMPYDPDKDFTPITHVANVPQVVLVNPSVKATSVKELIELAKANPGKINFGSVGNGSTLHLAGELFKTMAGVDLVHVPYKGSAPALNDILGGQIQLMFDVIVSGMPHAKAGRLRALAVTGSKRSSYAPELPTVAEAGLPGYEVVTWYGILAPAGMPAGLSKRLNEEIVKVLKAPDVASKLSTQGVDIVASSQDEFVSYLRSERDKWSKVIKQAGIKPQ